MKIKFLMAEEIRPEVNGKSTVLGLFADDVLVMAANRPEGTPPEVPDGLERLSFLLNASDLSEGVHKFKGNIIAPSGEVYNPETPLGEWTAEKGQSRSIVVEIKPFVVKGRGIYHFNFYVDDILSSFPFEIR